MTTGAVSAQAHIRAADVKAAMAAGRSQNKVRESLGIPLRGEAEEAADEE